ncbi:ASCH domain-containing protein [Vibrio vulnificus]|uniref:ASCH domain-containing protein n=1 Tax=Vibrio vulnificus TaxID=672 RepID=UPI0021DACA57|nr:ASCH domain-containing protein [Vibrio vulnificus]EHD1697968.1 ASCH domain-containing protein [Vibrio vulnificus]EKZ9225767.1 ASCH domain-containing protein [Vibrio vulnificus]ELC9582613.1 ASCH domain-containing protein [Vibrio vulnificus]MCU8150226.1 ASCH domain-containing protein [Vibrio vulnificus]
MIIHGVEIRKGLIVDQPWIDLILDGQKCWEMRSYATHFRGDFALIQKGTGHIVGLSTLIDSLAPLSTNELVVNSEKHRVDYQAQPELIKWNTPWVLDNSRRIEPVPYKHKQGAVIWVNL